MKLSSAKIYRSCPISLDHDYLVWENTNVNNEAFLSKIAVLGMEKPPIGREHFVPRPCLYFTFLHAVNVFRLQEQTFCRADAGRFRKGLKVKITEKTAGDSCWRHPVRVAEYTVSWRIRIFNCIEEVPRFFFLYRI